MFIVNELLIEEPMLDSLSAGLILFPEAIATAISMNLYGKFGSKIDIRIFAVAALILIGFNSYSMSRITLDTQNSTITILLMIRGFGVGFLMVPVQAIGFSGLPKAAMSNASDLRNIVKQICTAIVIIPTLLLKQGKQEEEAEAISVK